MNRSLQKNLILTAGLLTGTVSLMAQTTPAPASGIETKDLIQLLIFTTIVVAFVALLLTVTVLALIRVRQSEATAAAIAAAVASGQPVPEALAEAAKAPSPLSWKSINQALTRAVPVDKEDTIDLGHNYDGIRELDNSLPPWWKWGFVFTIAWGLVYVWHFHVSEIALAKVLFGPGISSAEEYNIAMKEADEQKEVYLAKVGNQIDEKNVTLVTDAEGLANGKTIFTTNCVVCHGANGEGGVGPNLTDKFWIHGGSVNKVFATIEYGVPAKGMIPWLGQLKPKEIQNVASYILSLQGTNPANPKAPEGAEYIPAPADSITAPADTAKAVAMTNP